MLLNPEFKELWSQRQAFVNILYKKVVNIHQPLSLRERDDGGNYWHSTSSEIKLGSFMLLKNLG